MTNEEFVALIQAGIDVTDNMGQLYQKNEGFIRKVAFPFSKTVELEDLMQEAYFGLEKAVQKFNPNEGVQFLTYAEHWIRQSVQRYCSNSGRAKRLPIHVMERISKYQKFRSDFRAVVGDEPIDQEYCAHLELTPAQLKTLRSYMAEDMPVSLDATLPGTEDFTLADTIPDGFSLEETVVDRLTDESGKAALWSAVSDLGGRYPTIIEDEYKNGRTLAQIAEQMSVSTERVRQLKKRAIQLLKRSRKAKEAAEIYGYGCGQSYHWGFGRFKETGTSSTEFLAIKRIENDESRCRISEQAQDLSSVAALSADRMKKTSGHVPKGIERWNAVNAEIDRMIQEYRENRKSGENHAEA